MDAEPGSIDSQRQNLNMHPSIPYLNENQAPTRAEMDASQGLVLLEFGTDWCGFCRGAQPLLADVRSQHPEWRYVKVEDGPGRALGRSYRIKLWPTVVVLRDGHEVGRVVRPTQVAELLAAMGTAKGAVQGL